MAKETVYLRMAAITKIAQVLFLQKEAPHGS